VLRGFTVGITANQRWADQAALFEQRGAAIAHGGSLGWDPVPGDGPSELTRAVVGSRPDAVVVTTATGFRRWMELAGRWGLDGPLRRTLGNSRIYARGLKAAGELRTAGFDIDGGGDTVRDTLDALLAGCPSVAQVVLQVDGSGEAPEATERLGRAGADVTLVSVYRWGLPPDRRPALRLAEAVLAGRVHAVTFTSRPAVLNWFQIAAEEGIDGPLRQTLARGAVVTGCVGPVCAEAAVAEGVDRRVLVIPTRPELERLVAAVADRLSSLVIRGAAGGQQLVVSGSAATIGGTEVSLTPAEARLLAALARLPNAAVSKEDLLHAVWEGQAHDPHLVELMVARLRRRLGVHGNVIAEIGPRGYTLRI
jgi:uroporphyrinogen-III synthase